jgi:hypothetical protein
MAEGKKGNLPAARAKVRITADAQSVGPLLRGSDNCAFDLAFNPGLNNDHLQPKVAHRSFRLLDVIPREARIVRIHKDRNPGGLRVPDPVIASATIPKQHIIFVNDDRNEAEIVVDPRRLRKLTVSDYVTPKD